MSDGYPQFERDKEIFGLYVKDHLTMESIGQKFGISKERVRQILRGLEAPKVSRKRFKLTLTVEQRQLQSVAKFWDQVDIHPDPDKCWEWKGYLHPNGYGRTCVRGARGYCHRFALELHRKTKLSQWVLHSCDNPSCCNPAHLREGTAMDNARDRESRGRARWQNPERPVKRNPQFYARNASIKAMREKGCSIAVIANEFGVHVATVYRVLSLNHASTQES